MKLAGKYALVTGASQGLGKAIAKAFLENGASVIICARNVDKLNKAKSDLESLLKNGQQLVVHSVDISRTEEVDNLIDFSLKTFPCLDILVNNAGVYGTKGTIEDIDWQEWVQAIQINLMGTVYTCKKVLPHFKARRYGKIINVSGGGATSPLPRLSAYAASKAAVVRFTETVAHETMGMGIDCNAIAPGALNTRLLDEILEAGPEKVGKEFYERSLKQQESGGTPLEKGASACVYLASSASDGITGKLISAVWDPWSDFQSHAEDIKSTDIYTLRRIVPKDRGMNWGD